MTRRYTEDEWRGIDPLLREMTISEIADGYAPMSQFTLRNRCKYLGITPIVKPRARPMKRKEVNELMSRWGVPCQK